MLRYFKEKCCGGEGGECTGLLPLVGTDKESTICDSAGNHCDLEGHLTHLDLSESNMHCDLADVNFLAQGLQNLQVRLHCCLLNKNGSLVNNLALSIMCSLPTPATSCGLGCRY